MKSKTLNINYLKKLNDEIYAFKKEKEIGLNKPIDVFTVIFQRYVKHFEDEKLKEDDDLIIAGNFPIIQPDTIIEAIWRLKREDIDETVRVRFRQHKNALNDILFSMWYEGKGRKYNSLNICLADRENRFDRKNENGVNEIEAQKIYKSIVKEKRGQNNVEEKENKPPIGISTTEERKDNQKFKIEQQTDTDTVYASGGKPTLEKEAQIDKKEFASCDKVIIGKQIKEPAKKRMALQIGIIVGIVLIGIMILILNYKEPLKPQDKNTANQNQINKKAKTKAINNLATETKIKPDYNENAFIGVNKEVQAVLQLAYKSKMNTAVPAAAAAVIVLSESNPSNPWHLLKNGDALSSTDSYKILLQPEATIYFYIFQIDSKGKLDWLFPANNVSPYSTGDNPVQTGYWTQAPKGEKALHLDENQGVEHIYIVAALNRWNELEKALEKASKSAAAAVPIRKPFNIRTRGVGGMRVINSPLPEKLVEISSKDTLQLFEGEEGILVKEAWFQHIEKHK